MNELFSIIPADKIGLGLVHFIWQGSVIALITSVVLFLFRNSKAQVRYILGYSSLVLMVLSPVVTILFDLHTQVDSVFESPTERFAPMQTKEIMIDGIYYGTQYRRSEPRITSNEKIDSYIARCLPYLTTVWFLGIFMSSLYHSFGYIRTQKLIHRDPQRIHSIWEARIQHLAKQLGIRRTLHIFSLSGLRIPSVLGCLKPTLLVPVSFFTGVESRYLEAIILHELAHIKRHDYVLNLIQVVIEILGFFHPAIWWMSKRIREERENCCDDMAIAAMGDKLIYVKSLVYLEESKSNESLVVAANGGNLFQRTVRILEYNSIDHTSSLLNAGGFVIASLCVLFLMGFMWNYSGNFWTEVQNREQSDKIIQAMVPHLIAYYPFNGNANDESGFHQDGVIHNALPTEDRRGRVGQAFDFNGKNSSIVVPKTSALNTSGSITISCWIYPRSCKWYGSWVSRANLNKRTSQWRTGFGEDKNNEWGLTESFWDGKQNLWKDYWVTHNAIPFNTWSCVTVVADQTIGKVFLYVNGKRVVQMEKLKPFEESNSPLFVGFQMDDNTFFDGKIDDVRIYNRALNNREVFALYNVN